MSQRDFSNFFGVPYGTVKNWDSRSCMPVYFYNLCCRFMDLIRGDWHEEKRNNVGFDGSCEDFRNGL